MVKMLAAFALLAYLALCAPGCVVQRPQVLTDDNGEPIGLAQEALGAGGAGGGDGEGGSGGSLCCCTAPSTAT